MQYFSEATDRFCFSGFFRNNSKYFHITLSILYNNICIFVINQWLYTIITLSSGPNRTRGRAIRGCSNKKVEKALGGLLDETGGCFKDITGKGFLFSIIRNGN